MDRVGTVTKFSQGLLVVRSDSVAYPSLGTAVIDEQLEEVGTIVDVIGPVDRPFVIVSPLDKSNMEPLLNQRIYTR